MKKLRIIDFKSKNDLFITVISLFISFGIINIELLGAIAFPLKDALVFTIIVMIAVVMLMIFILGDNDREYVLSNKLSLSTWRILTVLGVVFLPTYVFWILHNPFVLKKINNNIFSVIGIISSLIGFWLAIVKKAQIIKVIVTGQRVQYIDNIAYIDLESYFNVQALCYGENEDNIEFMGFCLNMDFQYIRDKLVGYQSKILNPIYDNGNKFIPTFELIKPHQLGRKYEMSGRFILNVLPEVNTKDKSEIKVEMLYRDSKDNYFGQLMYINISDTHDVS